MSIEIWITYVTTVLILMITPGPSQFLMLSNSLGNGFKRSCATAAGDLSANAIQMLVASAGLISVLYASEYTFIIIKWMGVVYLLFIGVKLILSGQPKKTVESTGSLKSIKKLYAQGFITSASNPKAIIFFAALFPQFLNPDNSIVIQLFVLGTTYLVIDGIFLSIYGTFADLINLRFKNHFISYLDKISGSFLIIAGILLGLKRIDP